MLSKTADVFATSLALIKEENVAYGVYRDYFITFYENKHNKVIDISCFLGDSDDNSIGYLNLSDCIKNNIEKYHITDYELSDGMIHLVSGAEISLLRDMLDAIIQILVENDVHGASYCSECGKAFPAGTKKKIVTVDGNRFLLCDNCTFEMMEQAKNTKPDAPVSVKPSIGKTVLGAIVGGIIGAVVYALLFMLIPVDNDDILKYFVCLAGLAVGALAFCGARVVAKGGYSKAFAWTVTVVSVLCTAIGHYAGCVVFAVRKYADLSTFKFTASPFFKVVFTNSNDLRFLAAGAVIGICGAGVALIFLISSLMKKNTVRDKVEVSVITLK